MEINESNMQIVLGPQDLERLGFKRMPCSCHCGHNESWYASTPSGDVTLGCTTCTLGFLILKKIRPEDREWTVEEIDADVNENAVLTTDSALQAFLQENDIENELDEAREAIRKDYRS